MHIVTSVGRFEVSTITPDSSFVRWPETAVFDTITSENEVVASYTNGDSIAFLEARHGEVVALLEKVLDNGVYHATFPVNPRNAMEPHDFDVQSWDLHNTGLPWSRKVELVADESSLILVNRFIRVIRAICTESSSR